MIVTFTLYMDPVNSWVSGNITGFELSSYSATNDYTNLLADPSFTLTSGTAPVGAPPTSGTSSVSWEFTVDLPDGLPTQLEAYATASSGVYVSVQVSGPPHMWSRQAFRGFLSGTNCSLGQYTGLPGTVQPLTDSATRIKCSAEIAASGHLSISSGVDSSWRAPQTVETGSVWLLEGAGGWELCEITPWGRVTRMRGGTPYTFGAARTGLTATRVVSPADMNKPTSSSVAKTEWHEKKRAVVGDTATDSWDMPSPSPMAPTALYVADALCTLLTLDMGGSYRATPLVVRVERITTVLLCTQGMFGTQVYVASTSAAVLHDSSGGAVFSFHSGISSSDDYAITVSGLTAGTTYSIDAVVDWRACSVDDFGTAQTKFT